MADLYSRSAPDAPQPSLRVSSSEGIDRAERTVVLAHRSDSSRRSCRRASMPRSIWGPRCEWCTTPTT